MIRACQRVCCLIGLFALTAQMWAHEGYRADRGQALQEKMARLGKNLKNLEQTGTIRVRLNGDDWTPAQPLNAIDEITFSKMQADGIPINGLCDDSTFIRRVNLLLTGRLPEPERTRVFLADVDPGKRAVLIDEILASEAFNSYWAFWFQEYFGSNAFLLRGGLLYYNDYLAEAVAQAKPLDDMARELILSSGLTDQVGEANFYARAAEGSRLPQDFWDNAAVHAADKFLGVPLLCISCHDGAYHLEDINLFLAERKREELWEMAAFFSGIVRRRGTTDNNQLISFNIATVNNPTYDATSDTGDRPPRNGGLISPKYMFTGAQPQAGQDSREAFVDMITSDRQFARNFANRFWGHLFGLAMVEPMDSFDPYRIDPDRALPEGWTHQALDLELLEHMASQIIAFDYDLRAYLRYVTNSATFQMSATFMPGNWEERFAPYYSRYLARRLDAEAVYDVIATATGVKVPLVQTTRAGSRTVELAQQLSDANQPRGRQFESVRAFLNAFGRGNRYDVFRNNDGNIGQALVLMNSSVVMDRLLHPDNRLFAYLASDMDAEQIIKELYLDVLCREPTEEEVVDLLSELASYSDPQDQITTVQWLLLNKVELAFVY